MGIGSNVKRIRTKLGMDQKTLASKLGVTAGAVSNYENDVSAPKEEVLFRMFEVLNVTPDELFEGCYTETKKSPAPEGTEVIGKEQSDRLYDALVASGLIVEDDLVAEDIRFLGCVVDLIVDWFARKKAE